MRVPVRGVHPEVAPPLQALHVLWKRNFQALFDKFSTPGAENVFQFGRVR